MTPQKPFPHVKGNSKRQKTLSIRCLIMTLIWLGWGLGDLNYFDARTEVMEHFLSFFTSSPDLLTNSQSQSPWSPSCSTIFQGKALCHQQILQSNFCPKPDMIFTVIYFFFKDTFSYKTEIYNSIWSFISNLKGGIKLYHHYLFILACTTSK